MVYLPPEAAEHCLAAAANEPEGSGKLYHWSVGVPPLELPQPAISAPVASRLPPGRPVLVSAGLLLHQRL